ncbi:hypothetical protein CO540_14905 [Micromonospora sp. WMMA2032]|uniref:hypothetical protein n=1 Tax=Micromonospora sp. WMMA2032 TaxID=2039870 RepID=UPI000C059A7C|nr:hypothetical protein [Micromonospora sp. WMMA2032]ATO14953.1 hypothetical protein CO540_14905 [Micromonospora sp. WMMA2032]
MSSTEALPSRLLGTIDRIPTSLEILTGPRSGRVSLPVRLAWSGPADFDIGDARERLTLYCLLLDCGQRSDIVQYVNTTLLRQDWPRIRRLTARRVTRLWERRLPDLIAGDGRAAPSTAGDRFRRR